MSNVQAILLGVVQGLTEYLPVSSSAHLVLLPKIMGWQFHPQESFIFDVLVQLGTLVGVVIYFFSPLKEVFVSVMTGIVRRDLFHDDKSRLGWLVVLATIPAGIVGLAFKDSLAIYFSSPLYSCCFLLVTGVLLVLAEALSTILKTKPTQFDALVIGCAQTLALFPGVSRSGATIAAGMACGLSRKNAAQFSFLMSIPIMLAASLVASVDLMNNKELFAVMTVPLILGFTTAAITGFFVIKWFMSFLSTQRLIWFALYCFTIGFYGIFYFYGING
jgi:undecaprenyl-diphosphatase